MDGGDAQSRLGEVQRPAFNLDGDLQPSRNIHGRSFREVPVEDLAAIAINGRTQMPAAGDIDVVGEVEEPLGHGEVLASLPLGDESVQLRSGCGDLLGEVI